MKIAISENYLKEYREYLLNHNTKEKEKYQKQINWKNIMYTLKWSEIIVCSCTFGMVLGFVLLGLFVNYFTNLPDSFYYECLLTIIIILFSILLVLPVIVIIWYLDKKTSLISHITANEKIIQICGNVPDDVFIEYLNEHHLYDLELMQFLCFIQHNPDSLLCCKVNKNKARLEFTYETDGVVKEEMFFADRIETRTDIKEDVLLWTPSELMLQISWKRNKK